jgi:hypothetical protein
MNETFKDRFLLNEYTELWARYRQVVDQLVANERYALIFSGAVWAWVIANKNEDIYVFVTWLPFVVTVFFFIKGHFFLYKVASQIVHHIGSIADKKKVRRFTWLLEKPGDAFARWQHLFWSTMAATNLIVAISLTWLSWSS